MNPVNAALPSSPENQRAVLDRNIRNGISNLWFFILLSAINAILSFANSSFSFIFSAVLPEYLVALGQYLKNETGNRTVLLVFVLLGLLFLGLCILSAILAKKTPGWLWLGIVLILFDSAFFLFICVVNGLENNILGNLIRLAFHIWMLYYLFKAVSSLKKLKSLPPEPVVYDVPCTDPSIPEPTFPDSSQPDRPAGFPAENGDALKDPSADPSERSDTFPNS